MSKTTRGDSVYSESNMTIISSNTQTTNNTKLNRQPKDSIKYASTIQEISEYDNSIMSGARNSTTSISKSEKKVKIVGQYKKAKSPSPTPGKGSVTSGTPKKPMSSMFKKKTRDSVKFSGGSQSGIGGSRKVRHSTSIPNITAGGHNFAESTVVPDSSKPRSQSRKSKKAESIVTISFAGGEKLQAVPQIAQLEAVLAKNSKAPKLDDYTRSTILDIRTATFYYLYTLANQYKDQLLAGGQLAREIEIKHFRYLRDTATIKNILKNFNLCKFAKIERGAARASKGGNNQSWVKIDYSWKLENPRYWTTILLKIAAFLKGATIKQCSFNMG